MRRFSQRNSLVTLSDINITPLLDLAFVLLIIFIITTPLLTQSLNLQLPIGGLPEKQPRSPKDFRTVEVAANGAYRLDKKSMTLDQIEAELVRFHQVNTNMVVVIRADKNGAYGLAADVLDRCLRNKIHQVSLKTQPPKR
jgi:biopolymer transport protein ExbD